MTLSRIAQKRDANEPEVVAALEAMGCSVDRLPGGEGRPDLLVGDPKTGGNYLIEVKMPGKAFNPAQKKWHAEWKGVAHVAWCPDQACSIVEGYRVKRMVRS